MNNKDEVEITSLLTKLYTMAEDVGAKTKTSDAEKQQKAGAAATASTGMGQGRAAKKAGSRFLDLKSTIIEELQNVHKMMEDESQRQSGKTSVAQGNNPKEIIAAQTEIRQAIRKLEQNWEELNSLYSNEAKKRKSRFTPEELEVQSALVTKLQAEIDKVKNASVKGYARGGDVASSLNTAALAELDAAPLFSSEIAAAGGANGGGGPSMKQAALTEDQQLQLQQIQERDDDFDAQLEAIGEGLTTLDEIAQKQGEEVKRQSVMLDNLGQRVDNVHEHVTNVNAKMKETLAEVGRSSDKICVDIMCIVMMLGFAAVVYNIFKSV